MFVKNRYSWSPPQAPWTQLLRGRVQEIPFYQMSQAALIREIREIESSGSKNVVSRQQHHLGTFQKCKSGLQRSIQRVPQYQCKASTRLGDTLSAPTPEARQDGLTNSDCIPSCILLCFGGLGHLPWSTLNPAPTLADLGNDGHEALGQRQWTQGVPWGLESARAPHASLSEK